MLKSSLFCLIKISNGNPEIQKRLYEMVTFNSYESESFGKSLLNIFNQALS